MLTISALNKRFGGIHVSRDIDLQVQPGQVHALVGPNGAGKTTLIGQISGTIKPDSGQIIFDGYALTKMATHRRAHIGLARSFQITSVVLAMTLAENVMLGAQSISGHSFRFWRPATSETVIRKQALECLASVGLADQAQTLAAHISHGEQRQLEIAMALALQPKLLLLDEPMAGMSKDETGRMITLLQSLKGQIAMLLVEHDMDAVFALADITSVLVNGQIIATGSNASIRGNPLVQQAYLGAPTR